MSRINWTVLDPQIMAMRDGGKSLSQIAEALGMPKNTISGHVRRKMGKKYSRRRDAPVENPINWSVLRPRIVEMRHEGRSTEKIASAIGVPVDKLRWYFDRCKQFGVAEKRTQVWHRNCLACEKSFKATSPYIRRCQSCRSSSCDSVFTACGSGARRNRGVVSL